MSELIKDYVSLTPSDGTAMQAYTACPRNTTGLPGILVFQEAFGVNTHIRDVTERIAGEGYYAIAPELFHRTAEKGFEGSYTDFNDVMPHMQAITPEGLGADITAAYQFMTEQKEVDAGKTASIGFCLGGRVSFLASILLPLKAAASFYGGDLAKMGGDRIGEIQCPLLLCWGGQDAHISKETIDSATGKLNEAGKDYVNVVFSKANHGFFCDVRSAYHPASAAEAWELVKAFWKVNL